MEIKTDTRNDLFKRNEIKALVEAEKNFSFDEAKKMMVEQTKKSEDSIDVYNVKGNFGSNKFTISANVYDSKEDLDKAEQKTQKQRKVEAEDAKKSAEVEASSEETPSEEKPEEEAKAVKEEKQAEEEAKE